MFLNTAGGNNMGAYDLQSGELFSGSPETRDAALDPNSARKAALGGAPAERAEFTRNVSVSIESFARGIKFCKALIESAARTNQPGGLWLLGDGGMGKTFILDAIHKQYSPQESLLTRHCPALSLAFSSRPSESQIMGELLLQLGQDPRTLHAKSNPELWNMLLDALKACRTQAILFDEAHHLWLTLRSKRIVDRAGGVVGDFLKRLYDDSGVAYIFAGTPGLGSFLEDDRQASTRWSGKLRLEKFVFDNRFIGLLAALDEALPMPEPTGLASEDLASRLFVSCDGNFRLLKNFLAEAVFVAASEGTPHITRKHFATAHFNRFCSETTPFDS